MNKQIAMTKVQKVKHPLVISRLFTPKRYLKAYRLVGRQNRSRWN
jgi:hypothetical protein